MKRAFLVVLGILILFAAEILRVYFIMPFPGSQHADTIKFAYFLDRHIVWIRGIGLIMVLPPLYYFLKNGRIWLKILLTLVVVLYGFLFYMFNFRFLADKMFYQPKEKSFAGIGKDSTGKDKLIIGVTINGDAKAYPIEIIGYHHQVKDTLGNQPIMVTYCTVCRTGRVYSPFVDGKYELFRLVGMDHFNAMFEDETTKSWWQQATGIAIAGKLKGKQLPEIMSAQMRLGDWMVLHPNSLVLQPDKNYKRRYDSLKGYDEGTIEGSLEKRDTSSWKFKSWVVGVTVGGKSKAYDWNMLIQNKVISDTVGHSPVLITIEPNNKTFYVFANTDNLHFSYDSTTQMLKENNTKTSWKMNGECMDGPMKGRTLVQIQAYQEFWHSWRTFHPATTMYQ
jgi:hypothetical protein